MGVTKTIDTKDAMDVARGWKTKLPLDMKANAKRADYWRTGATLIRIRDDVEIHQTLWVAGKPPSANA